MVNIFIADSPLFLASRFWPLDGRRLVSQDLIDCVRKPSWQTVTDTHPRFDWIFDRPNIQESVLAATGPSTYSDSAGMAKSVTVSECHSIRWCYVKILFRTKNCHLSRSVTLTGVTVSGRACTEVLPVTFLHVLFFHHCVAADFAADRCECQAALIAHSCPSPSRAPTQSPAEPMSPDKIGGEKGSQILLWYKVNRWSISALRLPTWKPNLHT